MLTVLAIVVVCRSDKLYQSYSFGRLLVQFQGAFEGFNDWGGRGYDDFVPGEVTKTAPSGDETT